MVSYRHSSSRTQHTRPTAGKIRLGAERLADVPARRTYSPPPLRLRRYGGGCPVARQ
eukprot:COSAG01_NODE_14068_length_1499_cov_105.833571_4_plen_56_part_01